MLNDDCRDMVNAVNYRAKDRLIKSKHILAVGSDVLNNVFGAEDSQRF